ncbi:MAG: ATP-binding protein [Desulforegulaceae bacterium]|nr:ATP-binding protein [Desulforegulaceae bacterium]
MLIQFSLENFKCIGKKQTLYMQPVRKIKDTGHELETGIAREPYVLPCVSIMGANASGKSTLIEGLFFLRWVVQNSSERKKDSIFPDKRFRLNPKYNNLPTSFEISFIADDNFLYEYHISFFPDKIEKEVLICVKNIKGSKKIVLINREKNNFELNSIIHPDSNILKVWKADINNQRTFLSYLGNKGDVDVFDMVLRWFGDLKNINNEKIPHVITSAMINAGTLKKENVLKLLGAADINIDNFSIKEEKTDIPSDALEFIASIISKQTRESLDFVSQKLLDSKSLSLVFEHKNISGESVAFDFENDESDGTRHFYSLSGPVLEALENGRVLIIDELNQSLHPFLLRKLIQLFTDKNTNKKGAQLIFTTHDVTVLDKTLLRPDEIYFIKKDEKLFEAELYSLAEFEGMGKNDRGEKIYKDYLSGRFGAVPDIDWESGF